MAQVKFYSVGSAATKSDANGIYFVEGGELYKGSTRFGLGRVTVAADFNPSESTLTEQARGDIVVTGGGDGWVFDGSDWKSIGGNISALTSSWRADISSYIAGLATGSSTSVITTITQSTDGTVSATAVSMPFETLYSVADGWLSLTQKVDTIESSVSDLEGRVTDIEGIVDASNSTVTANTITATSSLVANSEFTLAGTTVSEIVTAIGPSTGNGAATDTQLPTALAVAKAISSLDKVMHFVGAGTSLPTSAKAGDVYVFTADETNVPSGETGFKAGQEVVYTSESETYDRDNWEVIGDQNTYATKAYVDGTFALNAYSSTALVYSNASASTVPLALNAAGAAIDTLTASASTFASNKAQIGSSTTANFYGMLATVELKSDDDPTLVFTDGAAGSGIVSTSTDITSGATRLVTANAVYGFATNLISNAAWNSTSTGGDVVAVTVSIDTSTSSNKLQVGVEVSAATTAADVSNENKASYLVTAGAVSAYTAQEINSAISGLDATVSDSDKGVFVQIDEADGKLTAATVTVTAASQMEFGATGSSEVLATTAAVKDFYDNNLVWLDASGTAI